jgi:hypothetical protein
VRARRAGDRVWYTHMDSSHKHAHKKYTNTSRARPHAHTRLVGEVLGGGEGEAGGDDALDGGVVGEVEEEAHVLHGAVLLEVLREGEREKERE